MSQNDSPNFFVRFENHLAENSEHRRKVMDQLANNDWRMTAVESHIKEIKQTLTPVDAFIRSIKIIVWLSGAVAWIAGALLALFLWIMVEKNADIQAMQRTLGEHSSQISQTIALMRESMRGHERDVERIERAIEGKK